MQAIKNLWTAFARLAAALTKSAELVEAANDRAEIALALNTPEDISPPKPRIGKAK